MTCGIGGLFTHTSFDEEEATICLRLLSSLVERGRDAWGYYDGRSVYKEPGSFLDSDKYFTLVDDLLKAKTNIFICHTRMATYGDPNINKNNHPFTLEPLIFAHNGMIFVSEAYDNKWTITTDSFDYAYWIWKEYKLHNNDTIEGIQYGSKHVSGVWACWLYNKREKKTYIWRMFDKYVSCFFLQNEGFLIFGSTPFNIMDGLGVVKKGRRSQRWIQKLGINKILPGMIYEIWDANIDVAARYRFIRPSLSDYLKFKELFKDVGEWG